MISSRSRLAVLVGLLPTVAAALAIAACRSREPLGETIDLRLADYVGPQQRQVSTQLVLPDRERDGDRLGFGWAVRQPGDLEETVLEMRRETARIRFFSAAKDARALEIEAYWSGDPTDEAPLIGLKLNGRHLADLAIGDDWQSYRVDLPPELVRQGINLLQLQRGGSGVSPKHRTRFDRYLRLRYLRVLGAAASTPRSELPTEITVLDEAQSDSTRPVIQMPADSYLDLVTELPGSSRLVGLWELELGDAGARGPVTLYVELVDGDGQTQRLMAEELDASSAEPQRLVVDLARWSGEPVRLRLGVEGADEALVRWLDPRVVGRGEAGSVAFQGNEAASAPPRSGRLGRPDVVFILLDAARADAFSCYGGPYPTPALERLAAEGTRFSRALAPSSWTGQSVPGIFTGLFPDTLGIEHWESRLPPSVPTMASLLREQGYRTLLWSQHRFYRWQEDLQKGFAEVRLLRSPVVDAEELSAKLEASPKPTFAFVHLMPPHTPYEPPPPYRGLHSSWYRGEIPVSTGFLSQFPSRKPPEEVGAEDLRYIRDRYLEHAVLADSQVAEILNILRELERYEDTLVVVLSDHGEAFLEHGFFLHGQRLYEEFLHVPLLVKWPRGVEGFSSTIDEPVSLVDLVPTLVDGLDLSSDRGFQGISLLPTVFGEGTVRRPLYFTTRGQGLGSRPPRTSSALVLDSWKLIDNRVTLETELYNLADDPEEQRNLVEEMPLRALLLRQEFQRRIWLNEVFVESGGGEIDLETLKPEDIEHLRALGYLN